MNNLLKTEIYKAKRNLLVYITIVILVIMAFAVSFVFNKYNPLTGREALNLSLEFIKYTIFIISFILGMSIINDFLLGYISESIMCGYSRKDVYIAKGIVFGIINVIVTFIFPIVLTVISTIDNGFGCIFNVKELMYLLRVVILLALIVLSCSAIVQMIFFILKNTINIFIAFVVLNVFNFITALNVIGEGITEKTIFGQVTLAISEKITFAQQCEVIVVSLVILFLVYLIGISVFNKIDIE